MPDAMDEIAKIDSARSAVIQKIAELHGELKELNFEKERLCAGVELPTEPGWYVTADDTPARLGDDGVWDDGWGNSGPDYGPAWHPLPLTRLTPDRLGERDDS